MKFPSKQNNIVNPALSYVNLAQVSRFIGNIIMGNFSKALLLASCIALTSCGGSSGTSSGTTTPPPIENSYNVEGVSSKGPIAEATINIYRIEAKGDRGERVAGPYTTGADGSWNTDDDLPAGGPFEAVSTGGYYTDEATDTEVVLADDDELSGIIVSSGSSIEVAITPLTHAALLTAKHSIANFGMSASDAIRHAIGDMQASLGFDVTTTLPPAIDDLASKTNSQKLYTAILGGISELSTDSNITDTLSAAGKFDIAIALAQDLSDGKLDGSDINGAQITVTVDDSDIDLPTLDASGITPLIDATNNFAATVELLASTSLSDSTELAMGCHGTQALNDALTFGIDGDGFFTVELNGEDLFTRLGSHCLTEDGKVKSANGGYLQGFPVNSQGHISSSTPAVIQLFDSQQSVNDIDSIDITSAGTITVTYTDASTVIIARISVITFPSTAQLGELDNPYCFETESSGRSIAKEPGHAGAGSIDQGINDFSSFTSCYGEPSDKPSTSSNISFAGDSYLRFTNSEDGRIMYTKDMAFLMNKEGYVIYGNQPKNIVYKDGEWINDIETWHLNGYPTNSNGVLTSSTLTYMQINTGVSNPTATTEIVIGANIDAGQVEIIGTTTFDPADPSSYNHSTSTTIFDSLGTSHQLTVYFKKTSLLNTWQTYTFIDNAILPPANYTGVAPSNELYMTLTFGTNGSLQSIDDNGTIPINAGILSYGNFAVAGASDLVITIDYTSLTQFSGNFSVNSLEQDGYSAGEFTGMTINSSGELLASFSSGQTTVLGLIAAASFENPDLLVAGELGFFDPGETASILPVRYTDDEIISTL